MTMPQMPRHTPTPWGCGPSGSVMREKYTQPFCIYESAKPNLICGCFGDVAGGADTARANAALIVAAVNSHAALVAALDQAQIALTYAKDARGNEMIAMAAEGHARLALEMIAALRQPGDGGGE